MCFFLEVAIPIIHPCVRWAFRLKFRTVVSGFAGVDYAYADRGNQSGLAALLQGRLDR